MLFVGTSIIHPSTEGVFLLCNILDLLIYSSEFFYAPAQIFRDEILLFYVEIHHFFDIRRKERYENYFYPPRRTKL